MVTFLIVIYTLICEGFVLGVLINNDKVSDVVKVILLLFAIIVAPTFFGVAIGRIIMSAQPK